MSRLKNKISPGFFSLKKQTEIGRSNDVFISSISWVPKCSVLLMFAALAMGTLGWFDASDDSEYLETLRQMWSWPPGSERQADIHWGRFLIPVLGCCVRAFVSSSYWAGTIATFFCALATIWIVTFKWGREYHWSVPVLAGAFIATCPLFVVNSTAILPECYTTLFMVVAFQQHLAGRRECSLSCGFWVGFWIGLGTVCKQTAVLVVPILVLDTILRALRNHEHGAGVRQVMGLLLGGCLVFMMTMLFFLWWNGHPLYFIERTLQIGDVFKKEAACMAQSADRLTYFQLFNSSWFSYFGVCFVVGAAVSVVRGPCRLEGAVGLFILVYLAFGSVSLNGYVRALQHERYMIPAVPFLAMSTAYQVHSCMQRLAAWGANGRWLDYRHALVYLPILVLVGWSVFVTLLNNNPRFPLAKQIALITKATTDDSQRVFATNSCKDRYRPVLDDETFFRIETLAPQISVSEKHAIVAFWGDFGPQMEKAIAWDHAQIERLHVERSWMRRLIDRIRRKPSENYTRYSPLYLVTVDRSQPVKHSDIAVPWK